MRVLKFGGTSTGDAELLIRAAKILEDNAKQGQVVAVVSSPNKITNYLLKFIEYKIKNQNTLLSVKDRKIECIFSNLLLDLVNIQPKLNFNYLKNFLKSEFNKIKKILYSIKLFKHCPDKIYASIFYISGKISVVILEEILKVHNHQISIINPVKKLLAFGNYLDYTIDIAESTRRIKLDQIPETNIILMASAIAGNEKDEIVLLGNNGSEYSAVVLAACFNSNCCEIWTNVDGIYNCEVNQVPDARLLKSISYTEAIEMICFNSKILSLKIIKILIHFQITYSIKNITNIKAHGTMISNYSNQFSNSIKGIFSLNNIVMLNISGPLLKHVIGAASKIIDMISKNNILGFLLIQAYSDYDINVYVLKNDLEQIKQTLKEKFKFEFTNNLLNSIKIIKNLGVISVVGDSINTGLNKKIFSALANNNINTIAILKNNSKSSISIVVKNSEIINGVRLIYRSLFINHKIIEVFLIGVGGVGNTLLNQIYKQKDFLQKEKKIKLCVYGIANSQKSLTDFKGINLNNWKFALNKTKKIFSISKWINLIKKHNILNPVIVDCTSSQEVADRYADFLSNGFHVVTSNKKANTSSWNYYQKIRKIANSVNRKFLYETNVGAGLPVIQNLQNLLNTGDQLIRFSGILSGSLSFIFGKLDEGLSISEATKIARNMGFTEPDPREDLSGIDVARKLLILAREIGYQLELNDVIVEPVLPLDVMNKIQCIDKFMKSLSEFDDVFKNRVAKAHTCGNVLRFVGSIEKGGVCKVKIDEVGAQNPLYKIKNGENALAFYSHYYQPIPLVLRGYGAGNNVTAAGVFADLLHTLS
ncbi:bifunctional aspartate kinase/homoserine dehydrogenase I [Candidatus Pantoea edessiphila]|uniref:Bifunctional aspartokinase/homoserine dehydrogenase n=1 Tax=Candidatus Pantoea edessiphila TaxID=2044610 RepID=A0A2P5SW75_9GAMM|nr:bifunctional aspartate kinase/homoserine dehydrogenase I [Candidatus Pantoea edessiphila]PPI86573.1 bifunctional aspartate kinase/homoserine dehydrogenase I [Candidatus Pantoea edessiphila]